MPSLFAPAAPDRTRRFNMAASEAELREIARLAKTRGLTSSDLVRELLRGALDESNPDKNRGVR